MDEGISIETQPARFWAPVDQIMTTWRSSFERATVWELHREPANEGFYVVQRTTNHWPTLIGLDGPHLRPLPEVIPQHPRFAHCFVKETRLDAPGVEVRQLLEAGKGISVPLLEVKEHLGVDGRSYGIRFDSGGARDVRLRWWMGGPQEWSELTDWVSDLQHLFARLPGSQLGYDF